ncbi:TauD/TfdA family dioxygenase [Paraliomyxa miuraensis]|uniref:TauD/TfdA family dioxygenase n=1 Tax=Paraliomyxa miuraensis TaxID=376150 RepID=UPI002258D1C5|nr:TauD/TfdA family dioxygenase [Paraliomyxa miuraensis]MCX4247324.1 TauD/TfdA family dioxygenase [Paraliomyxa miuraensis]
MTHDDQARPELESSRSTFPLVILGEPGGDDLPTWFRCHADLVDSGLLTHGAIVLRGFGVQSQADFESFASVLSDRRLDYVYRSTPRTAVGDGIYTATEYPRHTTIPLHCENAYQDDWPMKLAFYCLAPPGTGGETTIARNARITQRIGSSIVDEFARRRVLYVRNYGVGVDIPWQTVFQTDRRVEVERYCVSKGIEVVWKPDGGLRTRQVCQGVARHPRTSQLLWFNQAHLFHISSLDPTTREALLSLRREEDLPRNAYFGDGEPIPEATLNRVREAHEEEASATPWRRGDILLVDNMLVAHGRTPFTGDRRILVAMFDPRSSHRS